MGYTKVLGAMFLMATVRGGHLGQSGGYGAPAVSSYGAPVGGPAYSSPSGYSAGYNGGSSHTGPGYSSSGHGGYDEQPKSYQFGYAVKDYASGNDYNRHETSDGNTIQGEYRVQLPDGRTQIVTYIADWKNGYRADVRYEGEAHYPTESSYNPSSNYGAPSPGYAEGSSYASHRESSAGYGTHSNDYEAGHTYGGASSPSYGPPGYGK
ncbi:pro-resilin-like [Zootermopsis nevadensis]|uniref:Pro-resilin n=1 Tax=Zootermopsis nevadensis TaxID=136037 RepID=A0A067R5F7_ZOONE|nr:pro-resilin-like [Zootermopsis nevadensis]KDR13342.1 Pro-resilin [Zootermopsis nevadensis]